MTPTVGSSRSQLCRCGMPTSPPPRSDATPERGVHAVCFSEIPAKLGLPSIHSGEWEPFFQACEETQTTINMHIGSSSQMPSTSADAPPAVAVSLSFNNAMASLCDYLFSGVLVDHPDLHARLQRGPDRLVALRARTHRRRLGRAPCLGWGRRSHPGAAIGRTGTARSTAASSATATVSSHCTSSARTTSPSRPTTPTTDSTWPHTKKVAEELMGHLEQDVVDKICRGNAIKMLRLDLDGLTARSPARLGPAAASQTTGRGRSLGDRPRSLGGDMLAIVSLFLVVLASLLVTRVATSMLTHDRPVPAVGAVPGTICVQWRRIHDHRVGIDRQPSGQTADRDDPDVARQRRASSRSSSRCCCPSRVSAPVGPQYGDLRSSWSACTCCCVWPPAAWANRALSRVIERALRSVHRSRHPRLRGSVAPHRQLVGRRDPRQGGRLAVRRIAARPCTPERGGDRARHRTRRRPVRRRAARATARLHPGDLAVLYGKRAHARPDRRSQPDRRGRDGLDRQPDRVHRGLSRTAEDRQGGRGQSTTNDQRQSSTSAPASTSTSARPNRSTPRTSTDDCDRRQ